MSDDESLSSNKSWRSRQSMKSQTLKGALKKTSYRTELKGNIDELNNNVYTYGSKSNGDWYNKITEAIADYAGHEYDKAMRELIINGNEILPEEPEQPKVKKDETVNPFTMEKYKMELKIYYDEMKLYKKNKAKIFIIIKGQCSLAMKTKIESNKEYKTIEEQDDVIKLMKLIKSLSHANIDVKYEYWSLSNAMAKLYNVKQESNESLMVYYKKFINMVEIAEVQHGSIVPIDLAKKDIDYSDENKREEVLLKARGKYLACVFMKSVDWKRYGTCIKELNNAYIAGQNNYPATMVEAVSYLSNYMDSNNDKGKGKILVSEKDIAGASFAQTPTGGKHCFTCGKVGYTKRTCPVCNPSHVNQSNIVLRDEMEMPIWMG